MLKKLVFLFVLCLASSFSTEKFISLQSHTLASRMEWHSLKRLANSYFLGFMGAEDFLFERQSVAGGQLNLGTWFGHQDVLYNWPLKDFSSYNVHLDLNNTKSYLWIFLNCDNEKCWAYRFSANAEYPSGLFQIANNGRFITSFPAGPVFPEDEHEFSVKKMDGNVYRLSADGNLIIDMKLELPYFPLRFRSGFSDVTVNNVEITSNSGTVKTVDFTPRFDFFRFTVIFILLSTISYFLFLRAANAAYLAHVVALMLLLIIYQFDERYWSHLYISARPNPTFARMNDFLVRLEDVRKRLFTGTNALQEQERFLGKPNPIWFQPFEDLQQKPMDIRIQDMQILTPDGNVKFTQDISLMSNISGVKIAFIGGSQAWGTGATKLAGTWPSLIVQQLAKESGKPVTGVNFSVCGAVLGDYFKKVKELAAFHPDLLIVSFGANDHPTADAQFRTQLKKWNETLKANGIKTLWAIEALNHENEPEETQKAAIIRQYAKTEGLEVVSLHNYFQREELRDSGLLWHDQVHFTDYGHVLASQFFIKNNTVRNLVGKAP